MLDAEQRLLVPRAEGNLAPLRPPRRKPKRLGRPGTVSRPGHAFVQLHRYVGPEKIRLDFDRPFGREDMRRSVQMAAERDGFFRDLGDAGQRHDLKAAAVGQDRFWPAHELVQAAEPSNALRRRTQHEVIGVAEKDVCVGLTDLVDGHRLDGSSGPDGHEGRRTNVAARRRQPSGTRCAINSVD